MTNQQKELMGLITLYEFKIDTEFTSFNFCAALAQAIIAKYPQILSEFVTKEKVIEKTETKLLDILYEKYKGKEINIYCSEVVK